MYNDSDNVSLNCEVPRPVDGAMLIIIATVGSVLALIGTIGNCMIIFVYMETKSLRAIPCNIFLINMAVGDASSCALGFPIYIMYHIEPQLRCNSIFVEFRTQFLAYIFMMSFLSISLISFERFFGIRYPYIYCEVVTVRKMVIVVILSWILCLMHIVIGRLLRGIYGSQNMFLYFTGVVLVILVVLNLAFFAYVYVTSRTHLQRDRRYQIRIKSQSQAAVLMGIVYGISWTGPLGIWMVGRHVDIDYLVTSCILPLLISPVSNLWVYAFRMRNFKQAFATVCRGRGVFPTQTTPVAYSLDILTTHDISNPRHVPEKN